jgi:hypothetical protein
MEHVSLSLTSEPLQSSVPITIDHVDSHGGVIIAPQITIHRLTGSQLHVHGGDGHTKPIVEIQEASISSTLRVDGDLTVSTSLQADTLHVNSLYLKDNAQLTIKGFLKTDELYVGRHSKALGNTIHCNQASCYGDANVMATTYLQINDLTTYGAEITSPSIHVNRGKIHNQSIVKATLQLRANVLSLEQSSIECPDTFCNSLELYYNSSFISRVQDSKLVTNHLVNGASIDVCAVQGVTVFICGGILHARQVLRCKELSICNGTVESPDVEARKVNFDGQFGVTTIIVPGRMMVYENFQAT